MPSGRKPDGAAPSWTTMLDRIAALAREVKENRHGAVAIQMAITASALIGMSALAVEVGFVLSQQRGMQMAADAAAAGASIALNKGYPAPATEARSIAAVAGYVDGANSVTVSVNNPPTSGAYTGDNTAIEIVIQKPYSTPMASLFGTSVLNASARAVAAGSMGTYCVLALDSTSSAALKLENNAILQPSPCSNRCGAAVNSSSASALYLDNNAAINAPVSVVGSWSLANGAALNCTPKKNYASPVADPYASMTFTTPASPCTVSGTTTVTIKPPVANGACALSSGLNYSNNVVLNFDPGAYYVASKLNIKNNVTVNGTSVTLIVNGNYAVDIGNNATFNLTAPTSGTYSGVAFASIRTASSSVTQEFSNNTYMNITGALYFPNQKVEFDNNTALSYNASGAKCTQLIARKIEFDNNGATLEHNCSGAGISEIGGSGSAGLKE